MLLEEHVSFFLVSASAICPHDAWKAASDLFNLSPKINGVKLRKIESICRERPSDQTASLRVNQLGNFNISKTSKFQPPGIFPDSLCSILMEN
jgi:hypothetical protein